MNDRDAAAIEWARDCLARGLLDSTKDDEHLRALISLASPSPAQTEREAIRPELMEALRERGGRGKFMRPSPAQWPEDVVERVRRTVEMKIREHMMRVSQTGERDDIVAWTEEITRAALAILPPPRVKGLVEALEPFAAVYDWDDAPRHFPEAPYELKGLRMHLTIDDMRRASEALASYRGGA